MSNSSIPKHGVTGNISISDEEIEMFLNYIKNRDPVTGEVYRSGEKVKDTKYRDVEIFYIDEDQFSLYQVLAKLALKVNNYFKYDIDGMERAQIMKYTAPSHGYNWHIDIGAEGSSLNRKIGLSILLNENYTGGEIAFRSGEEKRDIKPKKGEVVAFSSFIPHKINPITEGERYVIVAWFTGPPFK